MVLLAQAVAAILQTDTSAIVTLKKSGLDRPMKLDGKVYASYGARWALLTLTLGGCTAAPPLLYYSQLFHRYEGRIVRELIRADGGQGDFKEATPPVMGIFDTLLKVHLRKWHTTLLELTCFVTTAACTHGACTPL